jgi:SAM-dependent methyltransferase
MQTVLSKNRYRPARAENRMHGEGDVRAAREHFFARRGGNLEFLLRRRYEWMNDYIGPSDRGIEIGCGTGVSKLFIRAGEHQLTDYADHEWIDVKNVDALATPFADASFDFVISSNMIHHVPQPLQLFAEMRRVLKPGGWLLVQEINASLSMRFVLRLMRHEGYAFDANVFDPSEICTDPNDLWSANCAIPNLLFDDPAKFEQNVPFFRIERSTFSEFFLFLNSGGVIAKTASVPLPGFALKALAQIDRVLASSLPGVFALQRQIALRKI